MPYHSQPTVVDERLFFRYLGGGFQLSEVDPTVAEKS